MAQLRGKISEAAWVSVEDMLTGMVLGVLKNLSPLLLVELLSRAVPVEGKGRPSLSPPLKWTFWPSWRECEPDVVVEDAANLCVIEAKLYSDFGAGDVLQRQLAREWRDGLHRVRESGKKLWLVALTNHGSLPRDTILHQLKGSDAELERVAWFSWFEVGRALRQAPDDYLGGWRHDLLEVLTRMGLAPFNGVAELVQDARNRTTHLSPWVSTDILPSYTRVPAGFASTFTLVRTIGTPAHIGWQLRSRPRTPAVGFAPAFTCAHGLLEGGIPNWRLRLL